MQAAIYCRLTAYLKGRGRQVISRMECNLVPEWRWMIPVGAWQHSVYGLHEGSFRTLESIRKCSAHVRSQGTLFRWRCSWPRYRGWRYTTVSSRHTTHYLQPLDRPFFKPLKTFWQQAVYNWIHSNTVRKTTRFQLSTLLAAECNQAATVEKGCAGFTACGIQPYDTHSPHPIVLWMNAIPLLQ